MASPISVYSEVKTFLETKNADLKKKLDQIPFVREHIFKRHKDPKAQFDKAHSYFQIYTQFSQVKSEFEKKGKPFIEEFLTDVMQATVYLKKQMTDMEEAKELNQSLEEREKVFKPALNLYVSALEIENTPKILKKVYLKEMEGLRGADFIGDQYHLTIAVLDYLKEHWAVKFLKSAEKTDQKKLAPWEEKYQLLLQKQLERGISPIAEDNPDVLWNVADSFYQLFLVTPEENKRELLRNSLFPKPSSTPQELLETRPLNYLTFTGHYKALEAIAPYLTRDNWLSRGPFESTFMHCIIAGLEKGATKKGAPVKCVDLILKNVPEMATSVNRMGITPKVHLKHVLEKLRRNLDNMESFPGSKCGHCSFKDAKGGSYRETYREVSLTIKAGEQILEKFKSLGH